MTTKVLCPPVDGRADVVWNAIRLLKEEPGIRVVLLSFCAQPAVVHDQVETHELEWSGSLAGFLGGVLRGLPLQVSLYRNPRRTMELAREVGRLDLDVVVADMCRTSLVARALPARRHILDMDDRLSRRYRAQAGLGGSGGGFGKIPAWLPGELARLATPFSRLILRLEASRMARFEETVCARFDRVVLVSEAEARELAGVAGPNVVAIPNFVEFPGGPVAGGSRDAATVIFFGNLSTAHNLDTAVHLATEIFPGIRARLPRARLVLVGRNVSPRVKRAATGPGISVHADVPDIVPFLKSAALLVCPMRFGSGVKTKILEALYLGLPVVASPIGAEGIPDAASCMVVAEGPEATVEAAVSVLTGRRPAGPMIEAAHRMLERHFSREVVRRRWLEEVRGGG